MNAPIGHNGGPAMTALEIHALGIDDLFSTVSGSTASPVTTDEQESALDTLLDEVRTAKKAAEDQCEAEYRPHKQAADKVKADWKSVLSKCDKGADAIKAALTPYRTAKQRAKDEAARKLREEAEATARAAQQALKASDDLEDRFEAEARLEAAGKLAAQANRIDRAPTGLRTYWTAEITNRKAALLHYIAREPEAFEALIQSLADRDARGTRAPVPGITFHENKRAA